MEINGFKLFPAALDPHAQAGLVQAVLAAAGTAPYQPLTPGGKAMSVSQTSFGPLGWITDGPAIDTNQTIPKPAFPGRPCPRR